MIHKLHVSERDRLLAAGLLALILAFLLLGGPLDTRSPRTLIILGVFAAPALVFCISPLRHGSPVQRKLARLFLLPPLVYVVILVWVLLSGGLR